MVLKPTSVIKHWNSDDAVRPSTDAGLINETWLVGDPPSSVLQWVNPIFGPEIHHDIEAITAHLAESGLLTPRLRRTNTGTLWVPDAEGCWRMQDFVPGTTIHSISDPTQAASAAEFVGRFHASTATLDHDFHFVRPGAHDTLAHMQTLRNAIDMADEHPLVGPARALGQDILSDWSNWEGELDLPLRICHGDLKISNIRFDHDQRTTLCLIDLDTLSHQSLAMEMGDAWRSWCNRAGEDDPDSAEFDFAVFEASARAFLSTAPPLAEIERSNLVGGIERICLELSARFCADAVLNTYFKEDRQRFPELGAHNLLRARGQLQLARSAHAQRSACEAVIGR